MSVGGKVNLFGAKMNLVVPLAIVIVIGAVFLIMMDDDDDNGNGNGLCIINCPPKEVPLAIQARCDFHINAISANDITKGEPETAIAFLSINDEAGAIELAKALDEYPWYKLGSSTHGPHDIKGDNIPISQGGSELIPSNLRHRYALGRYVYMPGSSHDALMEMIEDNADNLEGLCK